MASSPRLNVALASTNVVVSWPEALDLVLQFSGGLSPANWTNVNQTPFVVSGQKTLALPLTGDTGFYRLKSP